MSSSVVTDQIVAAREREAKELARKAAEAMAEKRKTSSSSGTPPDPSGTVTSTAKPVVASTANPFSGSKPSPAPAPMVIGINTVLKDIPLESVDFASIVLGFLKVSKDLNGLEYTGGLSPVKKFHMIMKYEVTIQEIAVVLKTTEVRGHKLSNFAMKKDSSAALIKNAITKCKIAFPKIHATSMGYSGIHSIVSFKVAMSPYMIKLRQDLGPATFNGVQYTGSCPVIYQWMGSLSAMYHPGEDSESENGFIESIVNKIQWYEDFSEWYINVRAEAAKKNNSGSASTEDEKAQAKLRNRAWYPTALGSFSGECKSTWFTVNGSYKPMIPKEGNKDRYADAYLFDVFESLWNWPAADLNAAKKQVVKSDGTGAGSHKGSNSKK